MYLSKHFILSIFFVIALSYLFPQISFLGLILILASAVLIDVDHYLYYVFRKKDWNLKNAYSWHTLKRKELLKLSKKEKKFHNQEFCFLHGFEILSILYFLGLFAHNIFFFILIGFSFHIFLDLFVERVHGLKMNKVSVLYDFISTHKSLFKQE